MFQWHPRVLGGLKMTERPKMDSMKMLLRAGFCVGVFAWGIGASASAESVGALSSAFTPGEQATYKIQYLGITAGTAQITVGSQMRQWGKQVWPIVTLAQTDSMLALYPIKDKFVTYWDSVEARSIGSDLFADENRKRRRQRIKLDHTGKVATVVKQREGEEEVEDSYDIDTGALDIAAATFAIRNKPLAVGGAFDFPIFTGKKNFTLKATVESREMLLSPTGEKEVFKVRVQTEFVGKFAANRDMFIYLSTDDAHVPVKIEADFAIGSLVAELIDYKKGKAVLSASVDPGN
jgi:hypothetical protein